MRALGVELLRLRSRRAVWLLALLAVVATIGMLVIFAIEQAPPSAARIAGAQAQVDQQLADPSFQQMLKECQSAVAAGGNETFSADMNCADLNPRVEWFIGWAPPDFLDNLRFLLPAATMIAALAMILAGVTFVGADFAAGTIGTQLLFDPNRRRVFSAKLGAVLILAAVVAVVCIGLAVLVSYWTAATWGNTALVDRDLVTGEPRDVSAAAVVARPLRAVGLVLGGAAGGLGLATVLRSSLAAVGVIVGYAFVGEMVLRGLWQAGERWFASTQIIALLWGRHTIARQPSACGREGPCDPIITVITAGQAALTLGAVVIAIVGFAGWQFGRRDVN